MEFDKRGRFEPTIEQILYRKFEFRSARQFYNYFIINNLDA